MPAPRLCNSSGSVALPSLILASTSNHAYEQIRMPRADLRQEVNPVDALTIPMTRRRANKFAATLALSALAGRSVTRTNNVLAHDPSTPGAATPSGSGAQATLVWSYKGEGEDVLGGPAPVSALKTASPGQQTLIITSEAPIDAPIVILAP